MTAVLCCTVGTRILLGWSWFMGQTYTKGKSTLVAIALIDIQRLLQQPEEYSTRRTLTPVMQGLVRVNEVVHRSLLAPDHGVGIGTNWRCRTGFKTKKFVDETVQTNIYVEITNTKKTWSQNIIMRSSILLLY